MTTSLLAPPKRTGLLAHINPVAQLAATIPLALCVLAGLDVVSAGVALIGEFLFFAAAGLLNRRFWLRTLPVWIGAPLTGLSMTLYGKASGEIFWQFGFATISEGSLEIGLATVLRVLAVALPAVVLFIGIDPTDFADALAQIVRLPARFVLGALAGLRLVGLFISDWRAMELARRARGVADTGKVKRFLGQAQALLVLAIRRGSKLATAMEGRGFGAPVERTWARPSRLHPIDGVFIAGGVLLGATAITVSLIVGSWNFALG